MRERCAWIGLKPTPHYRRDSFARGFARHGFRIEVGFPRSAVSGDVLLIWNRFGESDRTAKMFECAGNTVLVAENGYLGKIVDGEPCYALSKNHHNGCGWIPSGTKERWEQMKVKLHPFRHSGETVLLPQRSIGEPGVAMPRDWLQFALARLPGRVRYHPGIKPCVSLECDLQAAGLVYTWGSGAAIKALTYGIPVVYDLDGWIGAQASSKIGQPLNRDEGQRLNMFQRLAWGMWRLSEIEDGSALGMMLQ